MTPRTLLRLLPLALVAPGPAAANNAPPSLAIDSDTPQVNVARRDAGRTPVRLPDLQYRFRLVPRCGTDGTPVNLSLSVADSRLTLDRDTLSTPGTKHSAELLIPASQLAPLPVSGFCERLPVDSGGGLSAAPAPDSRLTIRAALSAHAALLCATDDEQKITYVSKPLDLTLICNEEAAERADSP